MSRYYTAPNGGPESISAGVIREARRASAERALLDARTSILGLSTRTTGGYQAERDIDAYRANVLQTIKDTLDTIDARENTP